MFSKVSADDIAFVGALMAEKLPTSDIGKANQAFWCLSKNDQAVGNYGLERYGDDALLRSMVVLTAYKGHGFGAELAGHAIETARCEGIGSLWLLTKTAKGFFQHMGWAVTERGAAPEGIAGSDEFTGLCPASADCMRLSI